MLTHHVIVYSLVDTKHKFINQYRHCFLGFGENTDYLSMGFDFLAKISEDLFEI